MALRLIGGAADRCAVQFQVEIQCTQHAHGLFSDFGAYAVARQYRYLVGHEFSWMFQRVYTQKGLRRRGPCRPLSRACSSQSQPAPAAGPLCHRARFQPRMARQAFGLESPDQVGLL